MLHLARRRITVFTGASRGSRFANVAAASMTRCSPRPHQDPFRQRLTPSGRWPAMGLAWKTGRPLLNDRSPGAISATTLGSIPGPTRLLPFTKAMWSARQGHFVGSEPREVLLFEAPSARGACHGSRDVRVSPRGPPSILRGWGADLHWGRILGRAMSGDGGVVGSQIICLEGSGRAAGRPSGAALSRTSGRNAPRKRQIAVAV